MTVAAGLPDSLRARIKAYEQGYQFSAALQLCQSGLKEFPDCYELLNNLGRYLLLQGRVPEAVRIFERLLARHPDDYMLASNLLFYRHYSGETSGSELFAAHQEWSRKWIDSEVAVRPPLRKNRPPTSPIRVGFVSPDFRRHPVANFLEPLLRELDRDRFRLYGYARRVRFDDLTDRLRSYCEGWHEFDESGLDGTAERIRADGIDILVDLAGHTPGQCLRLFALRPAPVQCTYLGYPNTTGLPGIDFRLVDDHTDPLGQAEKWHTETLVRLPGTAWCYQPGPDAGTFDPTPPSLRHGRSITFGVFNSLAKISDQCLDWWGQIIRRVPGSRLLVKNYALHDLEGRQGFQRRALSAGFPIERLELLGGLPPYLHFQAFRMVDIMLDTFPYHGTTTTCETAWMGVPLVTLAGNFHVSRVGVSLLHALGLGSLIAYSSAEYVARAVELAEDPRRLLQEHQTLRARMEASVLMDAPGFARRFGAALESMLARSA